MTEPKYDRIELSPEAQAIAKQNRDSVASGGAMPSRRELLQAKLISEMGAINAELMAKLEAENTRLKEEKMPTPVELAKLDPDGHYQTLGIYPGFLETLEPQVADAFLGTVFRKLSSTFHPQAGNVSDIRMKKLSHAYQFLKTPERRANYGKAA